MDSIWCIGVIEVVQFCQQSFQYLVHFEEKEFERSFKEDDMEAYDEEAPIIFPTAVPTPAPAELLTVEAVGGLGVKELKDELRKGGRTCAPPVDIVCDNQMVSSMSPLTTNDE